MSCFYILLILLIILLFSSFHIVTNGRISFLRLNNISLCLFYISFIHLSIKGHISCFCVLANLNNATVKREVKCLFAILIAFLFDIYPEGWLLDLAVALFLISSGISVLCSVMNVLTSPPTVSQSPPFFTSLSTLVVSLFDNNPPNVCEVKSHCSLTYIYLMIKHSGHHFIHLLPMSFFSGEVYICLIFNWVIFGTEFYEFLIYFLY